MVVEEEGSKERRRALRLPVHLPVIGHPHDQTGPEIRGTMYNVSVGGMLAGFPVEVAVGSRLCSVIQTRAEPIGADCRVVWTKVAGGTVEHGLAFLEPKGRDFALYLAREQTH